MSATRNVCKAAYRLPGGRTGAFGCHTFFCRLDAGHAGEHKDWAGVWHPEWEKHAEPWEPSAHEVGEEGEGRAPEPRYQGRWVIVAEGEGAAARVLDERVDLHAAIHEFMCVCGKPWEQCDSLTPEELRFMDDPDEWTTDEDGERFSCSMRHETGSITLYRLERLAAAEPRGDALGDDFDGIKVNDLFDSQVADRPAASQPPQELEGLREALSKVQVNYDWPDPKKPGIAREYYFTPEDWALVQAALTRGEVGRG